ncbi:MAG: phage tail protein [Pseudomonadota bacterium]
MRDDGGRLTRRSLLRSLAALAAAGAVAPMGPTLLKTTVRNAEMHPVGTIVAFFDGRQRHYAICSKSGLTLCLGQEFSREDYPDLFAVIGTAYGVGDSSATFRLPDLRAHPGA